MDFKILVLLLIVVGMSGCITEDLASTDLVIGDTAITSDDIEISVSEYKFVDHFEQKAINDKINKYYPPDGAKFLLVYLKVTNVGEVETPSNTVSLSMFSFDSEEVDTPKLLYAGNEIKANKNNIAYGVSDSYSDKIYYGVLGSLNTHDLFLTVDRSYNPKFEGYGTAYPNVTKEGWVAFTVPAGIDLSQTKIEIHGLKWSF
ncbi:hypothetical protein [uncultured Methanolobus sp.]|uniref:hypothetical protein n=1 Tax=uncultured Methanolobus sp. TaxID=218300 RepID=UPI002AABA091|nr:hypothetical protein [uncultured Methanolobus sp.]